MIRDLMLASGATTRRTSVLIIGAGVAGLVLAHRLRAKGVPVIVLESGGRDQASDTHPLNEAVLIGQPYLGATHGRFRCLGGTSTRWGGALIPFSEHDFEPRPYLNLPGFSAGARAVWPYLSDAERLFGLSRTSYDDEFVHQIGAAKLVPLADADFRTRFAKWPSFRNRNLAVLLGPTLDRDPGAEIWLNANAVKLELDAENGKIKGVLAQSPTGQSISVFADHFVVCAGAIETTRLLLILNRQHDERLFPAAVLGHYLNDHISSVVAHIRPHDVYRLNRMAGFRFEGSTMRSLRFELSRELQIKEQVGSAFAHISFRTGQRTGFDALRDFMRGLQQKGRAEPKRLVEALRDSSYLMRLALWRAVYHQLLWPVPAQYELHLVAEQLPHPANRIGLGDKTDCFGLPLAAINWSISPGDLTTFSVFRRCFDGFWTRKELERIGRLDWTFHDEPASSLSGEDVYHPGGTTRMGDARHTAVVNADLRTFELSNLWLSSTSVFPSGGGENPTLTLILFTLRLADHLCSQLRLPAG